MRRRPFPFNYFTNFASAKCLFLERGSYSWGQLILVTLFLLALVILPVPFFYQGQTSTNLALYMPRVNKLLANPKLEQVAKTTPYTKSGYAFKGKQVLLTNRSEIVGVNLDKQDIASHKAALSLNNNSFVLKDKGVSYHLFYTKQFAPNQGKLKQQLSQTWFLRNKAAISFSMMTLVLNLFLVTNLLFSFGAAFFLWLARKSPALTINSYKEAVGLMIGILGPATLLTMIVEFVKFDISLAISIQMIAAVCLMLVVYAKTHFNEHYLNDERIGDRWNGGKKQLSIRFIPAHFKIATVMELGIYPELLAA